LDHEQRQDFVVDCSFWRDAAAGFGCRARLSAQGQLLKKFYLAGPTADPVMATIRC